MPADLSIKVSAPGVQEAIAQVASPDTIRKITEAAGEAVRQETLKHFRSREAEPERTAGFPKFGQAWGKKGFWSGNKGTSVAEAVGMPAWDAASQTVTIPIDSPALAHKADPNPPPILPKGGRQHLSLPANARASAWPGMPRDFMADGGALTFGFGLTPEGKWMPALLAKRHHLRAISRGARRGALVAASGDKATRGQGEPQFWLVRSVQTRHDPRAMPDTEVLTTRANARAATALRQLTAAKE
jgi:hypothetical protein